MIEFTDWARDILARADEAARRLNPDARVRLALTDAGMQAVLTDAAEPGDTLVEEAGFSIFVATGIEGLIDIEEPHDRIVLRAPGSTPSERPE